MVDVNNQPMYATRMETTVVGQAAAPETDVLLGYGKALQELVRASGDSGTERPVAEAPSDPQVHRLPEP
jgi:hypothetical protein